MANSRRKTIPRDISWLSFNARVLQEAADPSVPLRERIRFLGIFSNNLDEFFRVRVATLKRMIQVGTKAKMHLEANPESILEEIQMMVLNQQSEFNRIWNGILSELQEEKIFLVTEKDLNLEQQEFVQQYYEEEVSPNIIPLMIESIQELNFLRDKSIYLGVVMWKKESALKRMYSIIEIPTRVMSRFVILPSPENEHHIILLEDVIRFNLPEIFSYFGYDQYQSGVFKLTRDAEIDIDNDISTNLIQKIEKGIKNRRKGKPVRFIYDKEMDPGLLEYLIRKFNLSKRDNIIPGGRIHNFRHFMDFPKQIFNGESKRRKPFDHPLLLENRVTDVVMKRDVMLHFPYHSFNPVIDLLREAAIDPDVASIKITTYRLAKQSKVINALINAVRNGKQVMVMLEVRARFDEEANLAWKVRLEDEGVKVLIGIPNMKVHAKVCVIRKRVQDRIVQYGFVSTGNLNEDTARIYADHCLLTSNKNIMADVNRLFNYLEHYKTGTHFLKACNTIIPSPIFIRKEIIKLIRTEIKNVQKKGKGIITAKMNSLSDEELINELYEAARAGVEINLVIRGIFCMFSQDDKFLIPVKAISIVDEYLEHARVWIFHNGGKEKVYISSADWMVRNLDHRVEASCPIFDERIKKELKDILNIQLHDNVKARWLDNDLSNEYVRTQGEPIRSQVETFNYLNRKIEKPVEVSSN
ncbi:polyphosphate kinase 1 [Flavisolibacter ginsengisoli]|jgi:polyphosphate kinase|uniref:Polyphosphate kinase n=1 Tax=Flavisolibacter ginsengisoli DSM 18119 TaxID=1121884 RepID=A0A1M4XFX6_9BACT|nr:polyphosphate kinase 1 [Flavisolibacter ginsengisoli]SHE92454.1 polyphosphate kinase [Flavisolibacter ginsengisoli DSM 18119]